MLELFLYHILFCCKKIPAENFQILRYCTRYVLRGIRGTFHWITLCVWEALVNSFAAESKLKFLIFLKKYIKFIKMQQVII